MNETILTLNAGSSSLKFALFELDGQSLQLQFRGRLEGLGANVSMTVEDADGALLHRQNWSADEAAESVPRSAAEALHHMFAWLNANCPSLCVTAVGHRIVHGGPDFSRPMVLQDEVFKALESYSAWAPLHQPHNLAGVVAAQKLFPNAVQVACFDTAFHRTQPWVNDTYALPSKFYDEGIRRYGFHGLSYEYLIGKLRSIAPETAEGRVVMAHLGNGASLCALHEGRSIACTMGFTALDGLPMGTRCGQIDPGILLYLLQDRRMNADELSDLLYHNSGLKGLSGLSHDVRELEASELPAAAQALDYFVARIRRDIGGMAALLGGLEVIVFSGGIGEHADRIRERILSGFEWLGLECDPVRNAGGEQLIATDASTCRAYVIATDEETMIARHTLDVLHEVRSID